MNNTAIYEECNKNIHEKMDTLMDTLIGWNVKELEFYPKFKIIHNEYNCLNDTILFKSL